jgi:1-acyl-sn-glycerol-3-phosphate acyltransferase
MKKNITPVVCKFNQSVGNTAVKIALIILKLYFMVLKRTVDVKGSCSMPKGPKIIVMNHTPGFDPLYLPLILEETPHFLLQDGLFKIPLIGWLLKQTGQIPVYRGTNRVRETMEQACAVLSSGGTIAIFPEGKDVQLGERIPAKTGAVRMAIRTGAPVIPLGLFAPPENLTPLEFHWQGHQRSGAWQFAGKSYMRFGDPWQPEDRKNVRTLTAELMDHIYALVADARQDAQLELQGIYACSPVAGSAFQANCV